MSRLVVSLVVMLLSCQSAPPPFEQFLTAHPATEFDLLIHHGTLIDGSGQPGYPTDVLISSDTIAFVGTVDTSLIRVDRTIDATGNVVTPGFIDMHSHGDPLTTPDFHNFLAMGVTTIALGKDGASPDYRNLGDWMQQVADTVPGVNIAMFVGHGTLRMLSGINYNPRPTEEQLQTMGKLLADNLAAGCFGMTTGLEYVPGWYAPDYELEYLARMVGEQGKLITSHVRNEDDEAIEKSLRELLLQGQYCSVHVSHLKVVYGQGESRAEEVLQLLDSARRQGIKVSADVYPYTASYTGIGILFPEWAKPPNDFAQVVATRRDELATFLRNKVNQRNGPEATLLGTPPYAGKTLAQLATELGKPFEEILIDDIQPGGASGAYFVMNDSLQARFLRDSTVMISSDGSPTARHPRGHGTFAKIIEASVVQDHQLVLSEAIRKMTTLPARTMGITDRGRIAIGMKADVLIFDPEQVHATATYEEPLQLAKGFNMVIVNGKVAKEGEGFSGERYGQMLKSGSSSGRRQAGSSYK